MARTKYKLLEKYEPMIWKVAHLMSDSSEIEFEELEAEGHLVFSWLKYDYDKHRNFGTILWLLLTRELGRFVDRNTDPKRELMSGGSIGDWDPDSVPAHHPEWNPRERLIWKETVEALSGEARIIIDILLTRPAETLNLSGEESAKRVRDTLRSHLRTKGWEVKRIVAVFREIRELLREL